MKLIAWCSAVFVLVAVAVALGDAGSPGPGRAPGGGGDVQLVSSLRAFEGCDELLDYFREEARDAGVGAGVTAALEDSAAAGASGGGEAAPATTAAGADGAERAAAGFSGTNVQERDVDEPDVVKTDGARIVTVTGDVLRVVAPGAAGPALLGSVTIPAAGSSELLLTGDRVTVLTRSWAAATDDAGRVAPGMVGGSSATVLTTVDIADPRSPRVVESRTFEGDYASARMVGTLARVVLRSAPTIGYPEPAVLEDAGRAEAEAEDAVAEAPLDAWLPSDEDGPVVACDAVSRPADPAGVGTVTVLTFDVTSSLEPIDATAVVADAEVVYASTDRLYVATTRWASGCCGAPMPVEGDGGVGDAATTALVPAAEPAATDLHAFDTTGPTTRYLGSGRVAGRLLNSFALSEHEGTLRVATTIDAVDPEGASESAVVTLAERDGGLVEVGRLGGLGATEQIYAVRYAGDIGYVVTFRQTDPLYTVDLSDPAAPRLLGELKIPGYSAYLHPAEDGRLIGVGQDATDEGRALGAQVSTFDVSDLAAPVEEDRLTFPDGHSAVEWDHRAFLWWAPARVAVVPLETYAFDERTGEPLGDPFLGAVAVDVGTGGELAERGRVSHQAAAGPERFPAITRALVVGDVLYTVSEAGLMATDLATMVERGWLAF